MKRFTLACLSLALCVSAFGQSPPIVHEKDLMPNLATSQPIALHGVAWDAATAWGTQSSPTAPTHVGNYALLPTAVWFPRTGWEAVVNVPLAQVPTGWKKLPYVTYAAFSGVSVANGASLAGNDLFISEPVALGPGLSIGWKF